MEETNEETKRAEAYKIGIGVIILLAVFTIGEYLIGAIAVGWWVPLVVIALFKAFFVIRDYMHLGRLFEPEEEELA
jgi:fatty acid desaturase